MKRNCSAPPAVRTFSYHRNMPARSALIRGRTSCSVPPLQGNGFTLEVPKNFPGFTIPGTNTKATSTPGAGEIDSMLSGGYDLKKGSFTFGPTTSLQYTFFDAFPITEAGAGNLNFSSTSWYNASLLYSLGAHVANNWQVNKVILVVPQISLSWQHEFLQSPYAINGTSHVPITSTTPLRDTLYTGAGFTVEIGKNWDTSLFHNASAGNQDLASQNIFWSAGVKF